MREETENFGSAQSGEVQEPRYLLSVEFSDEQLSENLLLYSEQFDHGTWVSVGTPIVTANDDGVADLIEDDNAGAHEYKYQVVTNADNTARDTFSCKIKKDAVGRATRFPALSISYQGSVTENNYVHLDTETGEVNLSGDSSTLEGGIIDADDYWRVWLSSVPDDVGNTTLIVGVFPAFGEGSSWTVDPSSVGSCHFKEAQLSKSTVPLAYILAEGTAVASGLISTPDVMYFTSHADCLVPFDVPAHKIITSSLLSVSGSTQRLDVRKARHSIGSVTFQLGDREGLVTQAFYDQLQLGNGSRRRRVQLYKGHKILTAFADYSLRLTYRIDGVKTKDGRYSLECSDIQRAEKENIFFMDQAVLTSSIGKNDTEIPITVSNASEKFALLAHDANYSVHPSQDVGYIKIDDEIIAHSGWNGSFTELNVVERGALNTRKAAHTVTASADEQKKRIDEYIYFEMPAPKLIYAIQTGTLYNQSGKTFPWNLGMEDRYINLDDYLEIDPDLWDPSDDSGRYVRFMGVTEMEAKKFIEEELLVWMSCYMPVYSDGTIGLRKRDPSLPDSSFDLVIQQSDVLGYRDLMHDMDSVVNDITVNWNYIDSLDYFSRSDKYFSQISVDKHEVGEPEEYDFKGVFIGVHTDEDVYNFVQDVRDRRANPPLVVDVHVGPEFDLLEVGDTVRLELDALKDFNTNASVARTFEVLQVKDRWNTGSLWLSLMGGIEAAAAEPLSASNVMQDDFYDSEGTELSTLLTIAADEVTTNGSLSGGSNLKSSGNIFYYEGNLEIPDGVTVTIDRNAQLRIRGFFTLNGKIRLTGDKADDGYMGSTHSGRGANLSTHHGPNDPYPENRGYIVQRGNTNREKAKQNSVKTFKLKNPDGLSIGGLPQQLSGVQGRQGRKATHDAFAATTLPLGVPSDTEALGGSGGDPGGGLVIICRGMAAGVNSEIKTDGGDGSVGDYLESDGTAVGGVRRVYGQTGAGGHPGGVLILIDGDYSFPSFDSNNFKARLGNQDPPSQAGKFAKNGSITSVGLYGGSGDAGYGQNPNVNYTNRWQSCHRVQFIPPPKEPFVWLPEDERVESVQARGVAPVPDWEEITSENDLKPEDSATVGATAGVDLIDDTGSSPAVLSAPQIRNIDVQRGGRLSNIFAGGGLNTNYDHRGLAYNAATGRWVGIGFNSGGTTSKIRSAPNGRDWGGMSVNFPQSRRMYGVACRDYADNWVFVGENQGGDALIYNEFSMFDESDAAPALVTERSAGVNCDLFAVAYHENAPSAADYAHFVAVGQVESGTPAIIYTNTATTTWTRITPPGTFTVDLYDVINTALPLEGKGVDNNLWVFVGNDLGSEPLIGYLDDLDLSVAAAVKVSPTDGLAGALYQLAADGQGNVIACGDLIDDGGDIYAGIYYSTDWGQTWQRSSSGGSANHPIRPCYACGYGDGKFIVVTDRYSSNMRDLSYYPTIHVLSDPSDENWKQEVYQLPIHMQTRKVVYGDGRWVFIGNDPADTDSPICYTLQL